MSSESESEKFAVVTSYASQNRSAQFAEDLRELGFDRVEEVHPHGAAELVREKRDSITLLLIDVDVNVDNLGMRYFLLPHWKEPKPRKLLNIAKARASAMKVIMAHSFSIDTPETLLAQLTRKPHAIIKTEDKLPEAAGFQEFAIKKERQKNR